MPHDGQTQGPRGFPNILGLLRGTNLRLTGKAGATAGAGLAGGTTSGAPTAGQFDAGDLVVGQDGTLFVCSATGSPGTWVQLGATGAAGAAGANFTVGSIPAVRCRNSANISTTTSVAKTLTFDTNTFDQGTSPAQHSTSSNTSRLVCQQAGVYQITAGVEWQGNSTGSRDLWLLFNGTTVIAEVDQSPMGGGVFLQNVTTLYKLAVNDYIEVLVYQTSGGNLNLQTDAQESPQFMMVLVA